MKKVFSLALALIFVLSVFSAIPVSANTESIDDNLVIHYDFEGATVEAACKNKVNEEEYPLEEVWVKAGQTQTDRSFEYDTVNGTVTVNDNEKWRLSTTYVNETDGMANNTIFVRAKLKKDHNLRLAYIADVCYNTANQPMRLFYDKNNSKLSVYSTDIVDTTKTLSCAFTWPKVSEADDSEYAYVNFAVTIVEEEGTYYLNVFYSVGMPDSVSDWTTAIDHVKMGTSINQTTKFVAVASATGNWHSRVVIDDFRLYTKALTLAEIATIIPNGSFDMSEIASLYGTQYNKIADNDDDATNDKYNVRFVGTVGADITKYEKVGYEIVLSGTGVESKKFTLSSAHVFTSILGSDRSGISQEYTATALGSTGLFALTITNVPMEYDTYTIKTFVEDSEGNRTVTHTYTMERSAPWDTAAAE